MGVSKQLLVDAKVFTLMVEANSIRITERSWKVTKEMILGMYMLNWFTKMLEHCSTGVDREFYATSRDGGRSFIAQRCINPMGDSVVASEIYLHT